MEHLDIERDEASLKEQMSDNDGETTTSSELAQNPPNKKRVIDLTPLFNDLPTDVSTMEQVNKLPDDMKSNQDDDNYNADKPIKHVNDKTGEVFHYSLNPLTYCVFFILGVELLERFTYYGVVYTETSYLTGSYNKYWNPGLTAVGASSFVSMSSAIAYSTPFLGSTIADSFLGEYWSIIFGSLLFYIPSIVVLTLTTIPEFLGEEFNRMALSFALLVLWPIGTGTVKSVVNVFGAKQFHPLLQSSLIERYYVFFYMCINVGSLCGGIIVPIVAQHNVSVAYTIPVFMLGIGVLQFVCGTSRYCISKPKGSLVSGTIWNRFCKNSNRDKSIANDSWDDNDSGDDSSGSSSSGVSLWNVWIICGLCIPFNIGYNQMATTFIVQGTVMKKAFGFLDASTMNNCDAISVLLLGYLIGQKLYPFLASKDIKISTTNKFAIGSFLGACALLWAMLLEYLIHTTYERTGQSISILWQIPSFVFIGAGEILAISTAYETAFKASPPNKKAIASAINIFCIGGLPNFFCFGLYQLCSKFFENADGVSNIRTIEKYSEAHVIKYFFILFVIALVGVIINLLPAVKHIVLRMEESATEAIKTPKMMTPTIKQRKAAERELSKFKKTGELTPLLRAKEHQHYLKYGENPVLHKANSMKAGPFLSKTDDATKKIQAKNRKLYLLDHGLKRMTALARSPVGTPTTNRQRQRGGQKDSLLPTTTTNK